MQLPNTVYDSYSINEQANLTKSGGTVSTRKSSNASDGGSQKITFIEIVSKDEFDSTSKPIR